jgi:hypothetical protein
MPTTPLSSLGSRSRGLCDLIGTCRCPAVLPRKTDHASGSDLARPRSCSCVV